MEILGLEGMDAGGETTVKEAEEETQESDKSAAFTEHQKKKEKGRLPSEKEQERMGPEQPGDAAEGRKEWHSESKVPGNRTVDSRQTIREIPLSGVYINSGMDLSGMPVKQVLAMQEREQQGEHFRKRQKEWDGETGQEKEEPKAQEARGQEAQEREASGYMQEVQGQEGQLQECQEPQMETLQSQTQAANSAHKEEKPHQFKQGVDVIQPMSGVGNVLVQALRQWLSLSHKPLQMCLDPLVAAAVKVG